MPKDVVSTVQEKVTREKKVMQLPVLVQQISDTFAVCEPAGGTAAGFDYFGPLRVSRTTKRAGTVGRETVG